MARTIETIYNSIVTEKETQANLNGLLPLSEDYTNLTAELNTNSKVAQWRLHIYIVAVAIWTLEKLFDIYKQEVDIKADEAKPGTVKWWQNRLREFQYGDDVEIIDDAIVYPVKDTSKQILKMVAINELNTGVVTMKVAKVDGDSFQAIDTNEILAVQKYINTIKFAGTRTEVKSFNADLFKADIVIYYNPLLELAVIQTNVKHAINDYLKSLNENGRFIESQLEDKIQNVTGVEDVVINALYVKTGVGSYTQIGRDYSTLAGYIKADTSSGNSLDDTLTFTAEL